MWMLVYLKDYGAVYPRTSIPFTNRKGIEEEWPLAKHIEYNLIGYFRKEKKERNKQTGKYLNKMCGLRVNNDGKRGRLCSRYLCQTQADLHRKVCGWLGVPM